MSLLTTQRKPRAAATTRAYYRVVRGRTGFFDMVIRWYSRSPYTHAEFCCPLDNPSPPQYLGAQPKGGVAIRPFNYLGKQPFDTFYVEMTPQQAERIRQWLLKQIGKPYDFRAIFGMALPFLDHGRHDKAFFCSELLYAGMHEGGVALLNAPLRQADRITPRDIALSPVARLVKAQR